MLHPMRRAPLARRSRARSATSAARAPGFDEMRGWAWEILRGEGAPCRESEIARAHVIHNRAALARAHFQAHGAAHPHFGDGRLASLVSIRVGEADFADPDFCRALALVCDIQRGASLDPAPGAVAFHSHLANPDWARGREALALIGGYFFYGPQAASIPPSVG